MKRNNVLIGAMAKVRDARNKQGLTCHVPRRAPGTR